MHSDLNFTHNISLIFDWIFQQLLCRGRKTHQKPNLNFYLTAAVNECKDSSVQDHCENLK